MNIERELSLYGYALQGQQADQAERLIRQNELKMVNDRLTNRIAKNKSTQQERYYAQTLCQIEGRINAGTPKEEIIGAIRYGEFIMDIYSPFD